MSWRIFCSSALISARFGSSSAMTMSFFSAKGRLVRTAVRARDGEEVTDELCHLLHLVAHILDDLLQKRRLDRRVGQQEIRRGEYDGERCAQLMRGICGKLALTLVRLAHGLHRAAREDVADRCGADKGESPEHGERPCRLFHAVIHGGDILADVDRLDGQRRAEYGLRRHHDLGRRAALVRLRKDAHLPLGRIPHTNDVEHKGLDAV